MIGTVGVLQRQVDRLVFLVIGVRQEHRRQPVEGQFPVGLGIGDRVEMLLAPDRFMVGMMLERPRRAAASDNCSHMSSPANIVPIVPPHLAIAGWALRTIFSSSAIQLDRNAGS